MVFNLPVSLVHVAGPLQLDDEQYPQKLAFLSR